MEDSIKNEHLYNLIRTAEKYLGFTISKNVRTKEVRLGQTRMCIKKFHLILYDDAKY